MQPRPPTLKHATLFLSLSFSLCLSLSLSLPPPPHLSLSVCVCRYEALFPPVLSWLMFVWINMEQEAMHSQGVTGRQEVRDASHPHTHQIETQTHTRIQQYGHTH